MPGRASAEATGGGMANTVRYGVLSRDRKKEMFGLECAEALEWRNWTPGTEYSKNYVLKNVSTETLKINYKQTASKAFSMDFPESVKLRPGMSHALKVVFRPLKLQQYSDHIEMFCNNSSFIVLVEAYPPATQVEVRSQLDFGFVPTKELIKRPLTIRNTGNTQVGVTWTLEAPFSISPLSATFLPGQTASFEVSFEPLEACTYDVHALCTLDSGVSTTVKISGIGKFPYLSIESSSVDFGPVLVGRALERSFRFGNHSVVDANFTLEHAGGSEDGVFSITPTKGTLGPDEYTLMTVTFTPKHTGTFSSENFSVSTAGGNRLSLNLRGTAVGPVVSLSANSFNFGNVAAGQTPSRVLYLQNQSEVPVVYDFQLDPEDTFSISRPRGVIPAHTTAHVTITFRATAPANYWKRVACLIKDSDPLTIDLLATYYDDKSRPPPLSARHIATYMDRAAAGAAPVELDPASVSIPPSPVPSNPVSRPGSALDPMPAAGTGSLLAPGLAPADPPPSQPLVGPTAWQLFFDGQDPSHAVTTDVATLDFGTGSRLSASEYKTVTVTNNTSAKVTAFLSVPSWPDPSGDAPKQVFQAFPDFVDIKPHGQSSFRVAFRPPKDAQHYAQTLQLRAFVKSMRNFRLVPDALVVPPWTLPLLACGNTFLHTNPEYSPKVELTHSAVAFPPCRPGEHAHQTVMIANYGDTPASFSFNTAGLAPHFSVKPAQGLVPAKGSVLIGLRFRSEDARAASAQATCTFNGLAVTAAPLLLRGAAHSPRLTFDVPGDALYFRPTCVGASSQRSMAMHNPSRVPVAFAWQLPAKLHGVVSVSPAAGVLRGHESATAVWTFAPNQQKVLRQRVPCLLSSPGEAPSEAPGDAAALTVVGEGTQGALAIEPPALDLGALPVGHSVTRVVSLLNQSDGVLRYRLECGPEEGADGELEPGATPVEFPQQGLSAVEPREGEEIWVDEVEGTIPARASKEVTITFFPRFRKQYRLQVRCRTTTVAPLAAPAAAPPPPPGRPGSGGKLLPPLAKQRSSNGSLALGAAAVLGGLGASAALSSAAAPADDPDKWPPPAICPLTANTTFPGLLVTDVYLDAVPKHVLWSMLGVNRLNHELQKQVTELELDLSKMEVKGSLTTEIAMQALTPFVLNFGTHLVHGPDCQVSIEMSNATDLPVHWELNSPDNLDLEMENWVQPGRPRNEQEKAVDFIAEHRIFEVWPRAGVLERRGGAATVTMTYRPSHVGRHALPVFLRLRDGKRLQVVLAGETVAAPPRRLLAGPAQRLLRFEPAPLGEAAPPLHLQLLRSGGPGDTPFELDLTALQQLTRDSWGFEVIKLCSEASGTVPGGGVCPLNWRFTPLEARHYSVDVPVLLPNNCAEILTLQGLGYHPAAEAGAAPPAGDGGGGGGREWSEWRGFSSRPSANPSSGRLATLCHDVLSLGTTLTQATTRRVLVLTNTCQYPITFDWDAGVFPAAPPHKSGSGAAVQAGLTISPRSGALEPGERCVCRFSLEAGVAPQLLEAEVRCAVRVDEEAMFERAAEALRAAEEAGGPEALDYTDTGSVVEEVIAESKDRRDRAYAAERLKAGARSRMPLHLYMTTAIRNRIQNLDDQFTRTLDGMTQRRLAAAQAPDIPEPQTVAVAVSGRILTAAHVEAGCYIPEHELEEARLLLVGASWPPAPKEAPGAPALASGLSRLAEAEAEAEAEVGAEVEAEEQVEDTELRASVHGFEDGGAEGAGWPASGSAPGMADEAGQELPATSAGLPDSSDAATAAGSDAAPAEASAAEGPTEAAAAEKQHEGQQDGGGDDAAAAQSFRSAWRPLPAPEPVPAPPEPPLSREQQADKTALQVLQGLLCVALDPAKMSAVSQSWGCLQPERVPAFAELRQQLPAAFLSDADGAAPPAPEAEEELSATLHDPEFQAFAEYVLESAVLGLVSESVAGEWEH